MTSDFEADIVRPIEQKKKINNVQTFVKDAACHIHHQHIEGIHIQMGWTYPRLTQWYCKGKGWVLNLVKDLYTRLMSSTPGRQKRKEKKFLPPQ
jgi:hypothetical protein